MKQAGVPDKQAEAEARAVAAAIGEVDVATKLDIDDLRRDLQAMELRLTVELGTFMAMSIGVVAAVTKLLWAEKSSADLVIRLGRLGGKRNVMFSIKSLTCSA